MFDEYLAILAKCGRQTFEEMTATKVVQVVTKREQRLLDRFALALTVHYRDDQNNLAGRFVMGFQDETNAALLASAIAEKRGMAPFEDCQAGAMDLLSEFMFTVVNRTTAKWRELGLVASVSPPKVHLDMAFRPHRRLESDAFVVILNLCLGWVVINVSFEQPNRAAARKRILVVDDSVVIRGLLTKALDGMGCTVAQARSISEAMAKAGEGVHDLVIMDTVTARAGGQGSLLSLRTTLPSTRFIYLVDADDGGDADLFSGLHDHGRLKKPVRIDRFLAMVKEALEA